jgi:hypothetical protein
VRVATSAEWAKIVNLVLNFAAWVSAWTGGQQVRGWWWWRCSLVSYSHTRRHSSTLPASQYALSSNARVDNVRSPSTLAMSSISRSTCAGLALRANEVIKGLYTFLKPENLP